MAVILLLLLLMRTGVGKRCGVDTSIDITEGELFENGTIAYNGTRYTPDLYYVASDNKTRGCICKIVNCYRKCCGRTEIYHEGAGSCIGRSAVRLTKEQNETMYKYFEGFEKLEKENSLMQVNGFNELYVCNNESCLLRTDSYKSHRLTKAGELAIENVEAAIQEVDVESYCIDFMLYVNEKTGKMTLGREAYFRVKLHQEVKAYPPNYIELSIPHHQLLDIESGSDSEYSDEGDEYHVTSAQTEVQRDDKDLPLDVPTSIKLMETVMDVDDDKKEAKGKKRVNDNNDDKESVKDSDNEHVVDYFCDDCDERAEAGRSRVESRGQGHKQSKNTMQTSDSKLTPNPPATTGTALNPNNMAKALAAMLISIVFMLLTIAVYLILPDMKKSLHGRNLLCHLCSMLVSFVCVASMQISTISVNPTRTLCMIVSFIIYFSLLAAFFWLNVMCFDMWRKFRFIRRNVGDMERRFRRYCLYAFGLPLLLTVLLAALEYSPIEDHYLLPRMRKQECF
ncbi:G-protein coupled receptor Mth2 [Eumeta japonica]|uniref:G-protein coupled receptor Mth2 n=1 Tax=Eumeta variegata TaxID=151549 RepID=A0A4C1WPI0_EUMVA|nr:G-protein coupled receptor Mth2 [Eumeta japonica]